MSKVGVEPDLEGVRLGLHRLQRLLSSRRSSSALAVAAGVDLPQQVIQVLQVLQDGEPRSVADLARLARMDAAAVSRQVRALEDQGLVRRQASPNHGRIVLIEPTEAGLTAARRLRELSNRHLTDALAGWNPDDRETLGRLLVRLVDDLQGTPHRGTSTSE
jgi:DNA-binding MarR family transcriptional regulator